jgi:hypothetical protein
MFIGMLLLGPVALKLASTGYRFTRYYSGSRAYQEKGPPAIELRLLAPLVVATTIAVFATGVALLVVGPSSAGPLRMLHKLSFIAWIAVTALHVLGHLVELPRALATEAHSGRGGGTSGRGARLILLAGAIVGGLVIALLTESQFAAWVRFRHHG